MFPANSNYFKQVMDAATTVLSMSSNHIAHIQLPVMQAQTNQEEEQEEREQEEERGASRHTHLSTQKTPRSRLSILGAPSHVRVAS